MSKKLIEGNKKFIDSPTFKKQRSKLYDKQNPDTIVLSCSDSRNNPEIIFSQNDLGELFTVRSAGHVLCDSMIESIQYAVSNFDIKDIVVYGHSNCGGIVSVYNALENKSLYNPSYSDLFDYIEPSITHKYKTDEHNIIASTINNTFNTVKIIKRYVNKNIIPGYYDMYTGEVLFCFDNKKDKFIDYVINYQIE